MLLNGKTAVISGAAGPRGIGFAAARLFAEHGARVAILDIDRTAVQAAAKSLGSSHHGLVCDVTDQDACKRSAAEVIDRFGKIDILLNNAGDHAACEVHGNRPAELAADHRSQSDRYINLSAGRRAAYARAQKRVHRLHVVGVGTAGWRNSFRRPALLSCESGCPGPRQGDGARTRTRQHSRQLRDSGLIQTDITGGKLTDEMKSEIIKGIPLGRLGTAEDVARIYLFLASDLSSYTTGAVIDVNGGMLIH